METGVEGDVTRYPAPDELWNLTFASSIPTAAADSRIVDPSSNFRRISLPRQSSSRG